MPRSSPAGQGGAGDFAASASQRGRLDGPGVARRAKGQDGGRRQRQVGEQGSGHGWSPRFGCRTMGRHRTSPPLFATLLRQVGGGEGSALDAAAGAGSIGACARPPACRRRALGRAGSSPAWRSRKAPAARRPRRRARRRTVRRARPGGAPRRASAGWPASPTPPRRTGRCSSARCRRSAGAKAATTSSSMRRPKDVPSASRRSPPTWCSDASTPSSRPARRPAWRRATPRARRPYPWCSSSSAIRWDRAWWRAWRARGATSPAWAASVRGCMPSSSSCSRKPCRRCAAWPSSTTPSCRCTQPIGARSSRLPAASASSWCGSTCAPSRTWTRRSRPWRATRSRPCSSSASRSCSGRASGSRSWRWSSACRSSRRSWRWRTRGPSWPTVRASSTMSPAFPTTSIASSRARGRRSCRWSSRRASISSSIGRRRAVSASSCPPGVLARADEVVG